MKYLFANCQQNDRLAVVCTKRRGKRKCHRRLAIAFVVMQSAMAGTEPTSQGSQSADVDLFSDFQCPYCGQLALPIRELWTKVDDGKSVVVKFKNFPLPFHANAQLAAQAALAAGEQGKFWEMHDVLFANQKALQRPDLLRYAESLHLDMVRFQKDLDSEAIKKRIEADRAEGVKLGVTGTPTFFINGKKYTGTRTYEQLAKLVKDESRRMVALAEIDEKSMSKGPPGAPVTVEFFADLESPVSQMALSVLNNLIARYPSSVRLQFRNFPLSFHPQAALAHNAAMVGAHFGHFWEIAGYVFDHQNALQEPDIITYAGKAGMEEKQFAAMLQERRYQGRVDADLEEGAKRSIRGSPVIFVNGKRIDGVPGQKTLDEYVEAVLAAKTVEAKGRP